MDTSTKVNNFVGWKNCLSLHIPSTRDFSRFSFFGLTTAWWTLWRTLHSIKLPKPCWLSLHQQNRHKRSSLSKPRVQHLFNKGASSSLPNVSNRYLNPQRAGRGSSRSYHVCCLINFKQAKDFPDPFPPPHLPQPPTGFQQQSSREETVFWLNKASRIVRQQIFCLF